jgi:hypothetical protein
VAGFLADRGAFLEINAPIVLSQRKEDWKIYERMIRRRRPGPRAETRTESASVSHPSPRCEGKEELDRPGSRARDQRFLVKDHHRFMSRLERSKRDVERLAREAEELEVEAGKKRASWVKEVRNLNQLEGNVGFIEARLEGLIMTLPPASPPMVPTNIIIRTMPLRGIRRSGDHPPPTIP